MTDPDKPPRSLHQPISPEDLPQHPGDSPSRDQDSGGEVPAEVAAEVAAEASQISTFSLEGRRAPGLYLAGWLASILGAPLLLVAVVSGVAGPGALVLTIAGSLLLGLGLLAAAGAQAIERAGPVDLAYRGPSPLLVFGASIPLSILAAIPLILLGIDVTSPAATLTAIVQIDVIWLVLIGLTVVGPRAMRWAEIAAGIVDRGPTQILGDVAAGALTALPVLLATAVLGQLLVLIFGVIPEAPLPPSRDTAGLVVNLITAAAIAPLGEEIFYRGFATGAWARSVGPRAAIVRGGLFFAVAHILTLGGTDFGHAAAAAMVAFAVRIPVGLTLGWIFLARRSLPASIALHATFNGVLVLLAASVAP